MRAKRSTAKTPEEVRPQLLCLVASGIDVFTAMSRFPAAGRHVVPDLLESFVAEGLCERFGSTYVRVHTKR